MADKAETTDTTDPTDTAPDPITLVAQLETDLTVVHDGHEHLECVGYDPTGNSCDPIGLYSCKQPEGPETSIVPTKKVGTRAAAPTRTSGRSEHGLAYTGPSRNGW